MQYICPQTRKRTNEHLDHDDLQRMLCGPAARRHDIGTQPMCRLVANLIGKDVGTLIYDARAYDDKLWQAISASSNIPRNNGLVFTLEFADPGKLMQLLLDSSTWLQGLFLRTLERHPCTTLRGPMRSEQIQAMSNLCR